MDSDIRTLNIQEEQEMSLHSGSSGKPFSFSCGVGGVLPGGPVIKNLLCNAGMWVPSLFGGTKIPHAEEKNESACPSWRVRRSQQVTTKYRTSQRQISLEAMESTHATTKT